MKKTLPFSLLFGLGILSLVTAALSSFVFVSYSTAEGEEVIPPLENSGIVAESYYGDEETPFASYRSLPEALEDANSKAAAGSEVNVYLVPGQGDVIVNSAHLVVEKGVSLYLPYEGKKWDRDDTGDAATDISAIKGSGFADKDAAGVASNRKNHLVLRDSTLEIESGASLYVGGLFKTKGVCSSYAEITLDSSSSILVAGSFTNYGYVKTVEDSSDALSSFALRALQGEEEDRPEVRVFSGASVHTYIAVYDSLSNSLLVSLNSAGVCPVNAFDFPALQAPFTFESGSRLSAQMRMVMSVAGMQEAVDDAASVIAPSGEQSLFNLTSGEITLEYRPEVPGFTNADSSKTEIDLRGNLNMGYLYVELPASQKLDTSSMFFPFSYKLSLAVEDGATFSTNQDLKLLPGSSFRIEKGGTLEIGGHLVAYPASLVNGLIPNYPSDYDDASLVNNGTLIVSNGGGLGGEVLTESEDGSAYVDVTACHQADLTVASKEGTNGQSVSLSATAVFRLDEGNVTYPTMLIRAGTLFHSYSASEGEVSVPCWTDGYLKSFTLTVIAENPNGYEHPTLAYQIIRHDLDGNTIYLTPEGTSVSDLGTFTYTLAEGETYEIVSSERALSTDFVDDEGNVLTPAFVSGSTYAIESDVNVRIEAGEGVLVRFSCDPESGSSGGIQTVSEASSPSGTFINIFTATGQTSSDVVVRKGFYVTYRWDSGTYNFLNCQLDTRFYTWDSRLSVGDIDTYYQSHSDFSFETQEAAESSQGALGSGRYILSDPILVESEMQIHVRLVYDDEPDDLGGSSSGGGGTCLVEGTLVTMADGTKKKIEDVRQGDLLLAFDHLNGCLVAAPALFVDGEERALRTVTYLHFDDGTKLGIVEEHGLFDREANRYVYIHPDDASSYIGHEFYREDGSYATLKGVENVVENVRAYDLPTAGHLNFFSEGLLGMPGGIEGLFNIFELGPDMKVDEAKMEADIAAYGLFQYEDFAAYLSESVFDALPVKYLKVSLGKGLMDDGDIARLLRRYGPLLPDGQS